MNKWTNDKHPNIQIYEINIVPYTIWINQRPATLYVVAIIGSKEVYIDSCKYVMNKRTI